MADGRSPLAGVQGHQRLQAVQGEALDERQRPCVPSKTRDSTAMSLALSPLSTPVGLGRAGSGEAWRDSLFQCLPAGEPVVLANSSALPGLGGNYNQDHTCE